MNLFKRFRDSSPNAPTPTSCGRGIQEWTSDDLVLTIQTPPMGSVIDVPGFNLQVSS
jgi:hypothetical protein